MLTKLESAKMLVEKVRGMTENDANQKEIREKIIKEIEEYDEYFTEEQRKYIITKLNYLKYMSMPKDELIDLLRKEILYTLIKEDIDISLLSAREKTSLNKHLKLINISAFIH